VMLTRQPSLQLVVHELGHTFGLGHAQSAACLGPSRACGRFDETSDPFSPMGSGSSTSAPAKNRLGWIRPQPHVSAAKRYVQHPRPPVFPPGAHRGRGRAHGGSSTARNLSVICSSVRRRRDGDAAIRRRLSS
jgi:hypothetical protein